MLQGLFQSTTIPMLAEVVDFAQKRQTILAGNIANRDVPGYQPRDLSVEEFQSRLKEAVAAQSATGAESPGEPGFAENSPRAEIAGLSESMVCHNVSDMDFEGQVSGMAKNHLQHNLAIAIMTSQFHMLQTAISEKV